MAFSNRAQLHMLADEHDEAVLWGSRAIELAEKLGATDTLVHALNNVGTAELMAHNKQGGSPPRRSDRGGAPGRGTCASDGDRRASACRAVASARAEAAWLAGDVAGVKREAGLIFEMAKRQDPWIRGEVSFWLWRARGAPETDETIAAPYALQMRGDWRAAAAAWRTIGCPYEEAVALADGDEAARRAALGIFDRRHPFRSHQEIGKPGSP